MFSFQVIENLENQTPGFTVINKSYDQDQDADLWREGALFLKRKITRYLSISKTQGNFSLLSLLKKYFKYVYRNFSYCQQSV